MTHRQSLNLANISHYILFGAGQILIATANLLKQKGHAVDIYTAPRQLDDVLTADNKTFANLLDENQLDATSVEDINQCQEFLDSIGPNSLGLGFGEAWSFTPQVIQKFDGKLLDYMGIPLPQYRGGAHYTWALLNQETQWGCHFQIINEEMIQGEFDSGELVFSGTYTLDADLVTPDQFFDYAVAEEIKFINQFVERLNTDSSFELSLPDESQSLFFPRLHTLRNGWVNWRWRGAEIERFINAFGAPYAGASTRLNDQVIQLKGCQRINNKPFHPFESGLITRIVGSDIFVIVDDGILKIETVAIQGQQINETLKTGMRFITLQQDLEQAMLDQVTYSPAGTDMPPPSEDILTSERLRYQTLSMDDCNETYLSWLNDKRINQYLETRWSEQSISSIKSFVTATNDDPDSFLFGMFDINTNEHIGNIKIGPINRRHGYGDISYFIGDPNYWGKGLATEAITRVSQFGFDALQLHTIQAGVYSGNIGSIKALEKCGFELQAQIKEQLVGPNGREDHLWYSRKK